MASIGSLNDKKVGRLTSVPDEFLAKIPKAEKEVYDKVVELIARLEVKNGSYVVSTKNLRIAAEISDMLRPVLLGSDYTKYVTEFIGEFDQQAAVSNDLFKKAFPGFKAGEMAANVLNISKRNAIDLFLNRESDAKFVAPLRDIIEQAIVSGSGFRETLANIQDFIRGNEDVAGAMSRYSRTYAHDTFAIADRSYTSVVADELDAEWFFYSGDVIGTSRPFCEERHNQYFYYKEIEAWGDGRRTEGMAWPQDGTWAGEIPGTNSSTIYSYCAGYNCRHSIIPVSIFAVPKNVIERAIRTGMFTPSEKEAELLGL